MTYLVPVKSLIWFYEHLFGSEKSLIWFLYTYLVLKPTYLVLKTLIWFFSHLFGSKIWFQGDNQIL